MVNGTKEVVINLVKTIKKRVDRLCLLDPDFNRADGDAIILGAVGAGQFIGGMGVVENRPRGATARAASEGEVEILTRASSSIRSPARPGPRAN